MAADDRGGERRGERGSQRRLSLERSAATPASKPARVFACTDSGKRKRVEVPILDIRARVAAIELLLREGLGRPAQAVEPPTLTRIPETKAEIEARGWEELKALALA